MDEACERPRGDDVLPVGKLPAELLARLLREDGPRDPGVVVGPGVGLDCAVLAPGPGLLVAKSDPITFATAELGWYLVQVNANDLATTGAEPRWLLATLLLPEGATTAALVEGILRDVRDACRELGISLVGGHTEVTHGLGRPIVAGTLLGQVAPERLVTPRGARPGDVVLVTKSVPIEAAAILARERPERLAGSVTEAELRRATRYLRDPGISVVHDARVALAAGRVTAMHDPTEGGLAAALWEVAEASGRTIVFDRSAAPVDPLAGKICAAFGLDPLATIASGALLLTVGPDDAGIVRAALEREGIRCTPVGVVREGPAVVLVEGPDGPRLLPRPDRDEIGKAFAAG